MTATIQTIDTPDGAFTIIADPRGHVLASGWTADAEAARLRIHPRLRPETVTEGETDAAAAVRAYYAGDLSAIDAVAVAQDGTALQQRGWAALRRIAPGAPLPVAGGPDSCGSSARESPPSLSSEPGGGPPHAAGPHARGAR